MFKDVDESDDEDIGPALPPGFIPDASVISSNATRIVPDDNSDEEEDGPVISSFCTPV